MTYLNTRPIDSSHQTVWTNVSGSTTQKQLKESKIVIIKKGSPYHNGLAISTYFQDGDILLYSGKIPSFLAMGISETAKRWTSIEDIKKELTLHQRVWLVEENAGPLLIPLNDQGIPHVYLRERTQKAVPFNSFSESKAFPLKSE